MFSRLTNNLSNPFRLDFRSLALFRVMLGAILLFDVVYRWIDMMAHYSNRGVLPNETAESIISTYSFTLHTAFESGWWLILLFSMQTVLAVSLIVGYRTRLVAMLSFILMISLQNRNTLLLNGGDVLLRVTLFWSIFLPMNRRFSVDLAQGRVFKTAAKTCFNPVTIAIVVQVVLLYWQTAALKSGVAWRGSYDALFVALNMEQFASPVGTWFSQFREIGRVFTWVTIRLEDLAPILILTPLFAPLSRYVVIAFMLALHIGIISLMFIGIFPFLGIATVVPLLPSSFWDWLQARFERRKLVRLTVYYDQSCGICVSFVRLLSAFVVTHNVTVKHVYAYKTITAKSNKHNSWVGKIGNQYYYQADVFIEILRRSYVWWPLACLLSWRPLHKFATVIYRYVSSHRQSICKPPKPQTWWRRVYKRTDRAIGYAGQIVVAAMIVSVTVWVGSSVFNTEEVRVSSAFRQAASYIRIDQHWNMFAPTPLKYNSWYIVEGTTQNDKVDVWRGYYDNGNTELDFSRPEHSFATYTDLRWRRYLVRIQSGAYERYRSHFLQYLCNEWNQNQPDNQLESVRLIQMREDTSIVDPDTETILEKEQAVLSCEV